MPASGGRSFFKAGGRGEFLLRTTGITVWEKMPVARRQSATGVSMVGPSTVDGTACEHLAFRSPGVGWEIWIETASRALPRRLAVTFTDQPNSPRTVVEFSRWNLHPWLGQRDFP